MHQGLYVKDHQHSLQNEVMLTEVQSICPCLPWNSSRQHVEARKCCQKSCFGHIAEVASSSCQHLCILFFHMPASCVVMRSVWLMQPILKFTCSFKIQISLNQYVMTELPSFLCCCSSEKSLFLSLPESYYCGRMMVYLLYNTACAKA